MSKWQLQHFKFVVAVFKRCFRNQNLAAGIHKRDNMPSANETQQMIEDKITLITAQLDQLDYELDSRT